MEINLKDLTQTIPYKWRVQSVSKTYPSASCVAYIDARDVMQMLDDVVGPENWQSDYKEIKENMYAGIGIFLNGQWVWKWDCGTESQTDAEKGEASDAFKRAAVKWGIGRFLYELPIQYVKTNEKNLGNNRPYPVDDQGNKIKNLTEYINQNLGNSVKKTPEPKQEPAKKVTQISEKANAKQWNKIKLPSWLIDKFEDENNCNSHEKLFEIKENFIKWCKESKYNFSKEEFDEIYAYHHDRIANIPYSKVN